LKKVELFQVDLKVAFLKKNKFVPMSVVKNARCFNIKKRESLRVVLWLKEDEDDGNDKLLLFGFSIEYEIDKT
tara:strand:+ start:1249 stop:1467 length:219 start_codon:yes stop_codon:yes gene_type:complete